jgi:hypothetical protein
VSNTYFRIETDAARGLVRIVRTAQPMPTEASAVARAFSGLTEALRPFTGQKVLLDLRHGPPGRSDEAFEHASRNAGAALDRTFARVAVLVRSAVGKLQIRRLTEGRHNVFQDEAEALRYLDE